MSAESHTKCIFFKSSTLPGGFIKNSSSISNLNLNLHHPLLAHADFKNRIRSHEKPENLDSTWSKHVPTAPKTLSISRQKLTDNVSLAKTDRLKCETTCRIRLASRMVEIQWYIWSEIFKAAVRNSSDKIWRRCFEERIVEVCYQWLNLQMHTLFAVGPH